MKLNNLIKEEINNYINNIICESFSSQLFHFTSCNNLLNILKTNTFKLSNAKYDNRDEELNRGFIYYISFSRIKKTRYVDISNARNFQVRLWVDGDKLKRKYKGTPVNYFNYDSYEENAYNFNLGLYNESEDRLLSNKPTIDNFLHYVTRIDIDVSKSNFIDDLKMVCDDELSKIIYVYVDSKNFFNGSRKCYNLYNEYEKIIDITSKLNYDKTYHNHSYDNDNNFRLESNLHGIPNMYRAINDDDLENIYNSNTKKLISDIWFDYVNDFYNSVAKVSKNGLCNFIFPSGKLVSDEWFEYVDNFDKYGYAKVKYNNETKYLKLDGSIVNRNLSELLFNIRAERLLEAFRDGEDINNLYDTYTKTKEGIYVVSFSNLYNIIDRDKNYVSDKWFNHIYSFKNGFAKIELNSKCNFIDKNCNILYEPNNYSKWFDDVYFFENGFAKVSLNDKWNLIDTNGNLLKEDMWFDEIDTLKENFSNKFIKVKLNYKYNLIDRNGELFNPNEWYKSIFYINKYIIIASNNGKDTKYYNNNKESLNVNDILPYCTKCALNNLRDGKSPEDSFDNCKILDNGYKLVCLCFYWNYLDQNNNLISNKWFIRASEFNNGFANVELDGKEYKIDTNGKLYEY